MNARPKVYVLSLIFLLNIFVFSQTVEDGWKGIKPLRTNKVAVDKILGKPETDDNDYKRYSTDEAFIRVNYSTSPCKDNQYKRGEYNVPQDFILDYYVVLDKMVKLSDFKYKRGKYVKDTSGDLKSSALYINETDGVWLTVYIQEDAEYVTKIYYKPNKKNAEAFRCKEKL